MSSGATIADLAEFPFMGELPKREAKRVHSVWDKWAEVKAIIAARGTLIPVTFAAELGGVSRQRIHQLTQAGKLERVNVGDMSFISEASFMEWVKSERKTGRPLSHIPEDTISQAKFAARVAKCWSKEKP